VGSFQMVRSLNISFPIIGLIILIAITNCSAQCLIANETVASNCAGDHSNCTWSDPSLWVDCGASYPGIGSTAQLSALNYYSINIVSPIEVKEIVLGTHNRNPSQILNINSSLTTARLEISESGVLVLDGSIFINYQDNYTSSLFNNGTFIWTEGTITTIDYDPFIMTTSPMSIGSTAVLRIVGGDHNLGAEIRSSGTIVFDSFTSTSMNASITNTGPVLFAGPSVITGPLGVQYQQDGPILINLSDGENLIFNVTCIFHPVAPLTINRGTVTFGQSASISNVNIIVNSSLYLDQTGAEDVFGEFVFQNISNEGYIVWVGGGMLIMDSLINNGVVNIASNGSINGGQINNQGTLIISNSTIIDNAIFNNGTIMTDQPVIFQGLVETVIEFYAQDSVTFNDVMFLGGEFDATSATFLSSFWVMGDLYKDLQSPIEFLLEENTFILAGALNLDWEATITIGTEAKMNASEGLLMSNELGATLTTAGLTTGDFNLVGVNWINTGTFGDLNTISWVVARNGSQIQLLESSKLVLTVSNLLTSVIFLDGTFNKSTIALDGELTVYIRSDFDPSIGSIVLIDTSEGSYNTITGSFSSVKVVLEDGGLASHCKVLFSPSATSFSVLFGQCHPPEANNNSNSSSHRGRNAAIVIVILLVAVAAVGAFLYWRRRDDVNRWVDRIRTRSSGRQANEATGLL